MIGLLLILLVVGVTLTVVLWAGTVYLQSYLYTEASTDVFWQAPAAAAALTLFFTVWCLLDANAEGARADDLPYDTILRFSAEESKSKKPLPHLWVTTKSEKKQTKYVWDAGKGKYVLQYQDGSRGLAWSSVGVVEIVSKEDGRESRFVPQPIERGDDQRFVDPEGWTLVVYPEGPKAAPTIFRTGRFVANIFLNLFHFGVWFACLWLLLRFQLSHALGLAVVLWLIMTVAILPMLLMQAGATAQELATPQKAASAPLDRLLACR